MSIWCSGAIIGTDPSDGKFRDLNGKPIPAEGAQHGNVLSYAEGFSNHHPDLTGSHERPAAIGLSFIAPWCVPGHNQDGSDYSCTGCGGSHDTEMGPWLRLEVAAPQTLNYWRKDADGNPAVEAADATVVLDADAVRSLRDDLNRWLDAERLDPLTAPPTTDQAADGLGGGASE